MENCRYCRQPVRGDIDGHELNCFMRPGLQNELRYVIRQNARIVSKDGRVLHKIIVDPEEYDRLKSDYLPDSNKIIEVFGSWDVFAIWCGVSARSDVFHLPNGDLGWDDSRSKQSIDWDPWIERMFSTDGLVYYPIKVKPELKSYFNWSTYNWELGVVFTVL